jgi:hypothetical protein
MKNTGSELIREIVGPAGFTSEGVCSGRYCSDAEDEDEEEDDELCPSAPSPVGDWARAAPVPRPAQSKKTAENTAAGRIVRSFICETLSASLF